MKSNRYSILADYSMWMLLASNVITIYLAVAGGWALSTILWIYWFQSVIIGLFNFVRILQLKNFSTEGFRINGKEVEPTNFTRYFTAFFFLFHYGFFHTFYGLFLLVSSFQSSLAGGFTFSRREGFISSASSTIQSPDFGLILVVVAVFFFSHLFSYVYNHKKETHGQNIGKVAFYPYIRILPMHFIIIFGSFAGNMLLLFLIMKTAADVVMHVREHRMYRRKAASAG
ncbi:MAG: DUF6498-containing protein [Candidatus Paceibacterota bacterium]